VSKSRVGLTGYKQNMSTGSPTTKKGSVSAPPKKTKLRGLGKLASNDSKAQLLEYVVKKRVDNLDYIRRVHEGKVFWLNCVKITPQDIEQYYHPQTLQKRYVIKDKHDCLPYY
jgi:hypothetical protein